MIYKQIRGERDLDVYRTLASLTDDEAEKCLAGVVEGVSIQEPGFRELIAAPASLSSVLEDLHATGQSISLSEHTLANKPKAIRAVLLELTDQADTRLRIERFVVEYRKQLVEPVTTAIVTSGIVMLLSTRFGFEYERSGGKTRLKLSAEKKPTADAIVSKFLKYFGI